MGVIRNGAAAVGGGAAGSGGGGGGGDRNTDVVNEESIVMGVCMCPGVVMRINAGVWVVRVRWAGG